MKGRILLALAMLALAACSNNVGPAGLAVGGPCVDLFDCVTGSFCLTSRAFPNGMCTIHCEGNEDCRNGSQCLDDEGGVCAVDCVEDAECRSGYVCADRPIRGASTASVCVGG